MVNAEQITLKIADDYMHPSQLLINQFMRRDIGNVTVVFGEHPVRDKGICMQGLPWRNGLFGKDLDAVPCHLTKTQDAGVFVINHSLEHFIAASKTRQWDRETIDPAF